jgi:hypothetical protein
MSKTNEQKRHWVGTVQLKHLESEEEEDFFEDLESAWADLGSDTRIKYACGQFERGELGTLHGQVYIEFEKSVRVTQVVKALPGHWESRRGSRTAAKDYCTKSESRVEALPDIGEWRAERSGGGVMELGPKARALDYIVRQGLTPAEVAVEDPACYFTFHTAIKALYEAMNGKDRWLPEK